MYVWLCECVEEKPTNDKSNPSTYVNKTGMQFCIVADIFCFTFIITGHILFIFMKTHVYSVLFNRSSDH